jgi:complement component 1 Q subcomponent-binding protein
MPEPENDQDGDTDDDQEDRDPKFSTPLTVTISKNNGLSLEFTCTAYTDEIIIDTLSVRLPAAHDEEELEGLNFFT